MPRYFIVAGVDYGTSFTKVVLRDINRPKSNAVVVQFPDFPDGLLDSLVGIHGNSLVFNPASKECAQVPYLKMMAANVAVKNSLEPTTICLPKGLQALRRSGNDRVIVRDLMAFYFAHVIAATEDFIRTSSPWKDFDFTSRDQEDLLIFQLAVPAGLMNDDGASDRLFREAFIAGYELREKILSPKGLKGKIRAMIGRTTSYKEAIGRAKPYKEWSEIVNQTLSGDPGISDSRFEWQCTLYPEVAAAVQSVFRAPNAIDGLYITMDVGGGTVDLNAFRRFNGHLYYYSAIVRPLGVHHLNDVRRIVRPISEADLSKELRKSLRELYGLAKKKQDNLWAPPGQRTWDRAIIYIFGGGAHHPIYREILIDELKELGIYSPNPLNLLAAQDISPKGIEFGRFAVAYGLSYFRPNLDKVTLPQELPDFRKLYPVRPPRQYGFNWDD